MADEQGGIPPGWYPDETSGGQRYWDGTQWTEYTDQNYPQQAGGVQPSGGVQPGNYVANQQIDPWLWQSIVATILCCLPFGIAGIVFASRANADMGVGNWASAAENARKARMWTLLAVGIGLAVIVAYIVFIFAVGLSIDSSF